MGKITLHVTPTANMKQLQHCIPRNMVCFMYITVNTMHKGAIKDDDDDDDNDNNNSNNLYLQIFTETYILIFQVNRCFYYLG
jgi:hypothetical protein